MDRLAVSLILESFVVLLACNLALAAPGDLRQTIPNPMPGRGESFGWSVAAVGDNFLVGAIEDNNGVGAAYLIDGSTSALSI